MSIPHPLRHSRAGGNPGGAYGHPRTQPWSPAVAAMTPRTRGIVVINPNNPTGVVYSVDPERNIHYAGLAAQLPVLTWKHESSIRLGGSVAQDQDEASHVVTRAPNLYKGMVALALGIPGTDSRIYAAYSPTYRRAIKEWNHEVTLMLDASVFVKLLK